MEVYPDFGLFLMIGLLFAPFGGLAAFLIIYEEYSHHGFSRGRLIREGLAAAFTAASVLIVVALVAGFFIGPWGT